ncbi:MAG: RNA methyltransferase [Fibrobacter sp.]|jgi:TrmH family RNA methyltransferase|nr:RNA methyltransferase [Fibrobacter sp.]
MTDFAIVLVEPEHPHNVGFVARAMRANGLSDLRIVYVGKNAVMEESYRTAHHSGEILRAAKVVPALSEAVGDCSLSVAVSRRAFDSIINSLTLPELPGNLPAKGKTALVFGRESKGLLIQEVESCAFTCEIPVPGNMSLNLAQAVSVVCYELCRSGLLNGAGIIERTELKKEKKEFATLSEMQNFLAYVKAHLSERYRNQPWTNASMAKLLQRLQPTRVEMGALFGLVRSLTGSFARKEKESS